MTVIAVCKIIYYNNPMEFRNNKNAYDFIK